jgi:hypothetical protein
VANILTEIEAANVLRVDVDDPLIGDLLPQVDAYILQATGRDWTADTTIRPEAKSAARMLLVRWHEDPGGLGSGAATLDFGLRAALVQLEALAMRYKAFQGRDGAGAVALPGAVVGDTVVTVTGLAGVSGDQRSSFESRITVDDEIQQAATGDLSANWYQVYLVPIGGSA